MRRVLLTFVIIQISYSADLLSGADYFASPKGTPGGDGSMDAPWDLQTALNQPKPVGPGDVIWLLGGRYKGTFTSNLAGSAEAPIIVRQYPGECAILDGGAATILQSVLLVNGSNTWYWGFTVMSSSNQRSTGQSGSAPTDLNLPTGLYIIGDSNRFINLIVHDTAGSGFWSSLNNVYSEISGSLIYYNGWDAPDRGHGHGIYTQNQTGAKRIADNIIFNQFGLGIQAYGTSAAYLNNFTIDGNTIFDDTVMSGVSHDGYEILLGGGSVAQSPTITNNYTYEGLTGGGNAIGYQSGCANGTVQNNYFGGGLLQWNCPNTTVTGNTFYGAEQFSAAAFPNNTYYGATPTQTQIFIRPNAYEPGRANITIYNWTGATAVAVDLSSAGLPVGSPFQILDAQNFFAAPVISGVYTGAPVQVPMTGTAVTIPNGNVPSIPPHTQPAFGVFVLLPTSPSLDTGKLITPSIANVEATDIGYSTARITWTTDTGSDTQVDYGDNPKAFRASTSLDSTAAMSHSVSLTGLIPNTPYQFRVKSRNSGGLSISADYTFTTQAAPAPRGINVALKKPASESSMSQWSTGPNDAQGGNDGVKNGYFGFCTNLEANPWWQVDLEQILPLTEVRVYNRLDCCYDRARTVQILLSSDGINWSLAYANTGDTFGGIDGRPLIVALGGTQARYVRLQLNETNYLHLDEIEVYSTNVPPAVAPAHDTKFGVRH